MSNTDRVRLAPGRPERRAAETTLAMWRDAMGEGDLPRLADIKIQYDGDGWEHRFLLIEDPNPLWSVFILCGATARLAFDGAVVGRSLEEVMLPHGQPLVDACLAALRDRVPVQASGSFPARGGQRLVYRAVFLPMRGDVGAPRYVLGTFGWRREPASPAEEESS